MSFGNFMNRKQHPLVEGVNEGMQNSTPRLSVLSTPVANYPTYPQQQTLQQNTNSGSGDLSGIVQAAAPLLKTGISKFGDYLGGLGGDTSNSSIISSTADSFINGTNGNDYGISSAINSYVGDNAFNDGSIAGAIGDNVGGGLGGGFGYIGLAKGLMNGLGQGIESANDPDKETYLGGVGNGIQGFFGVNDDQSDIEQGINGAINGAMTGTAIFPGIGTAIGGLLGLGSSFIDDIGG